LSSATVFYAFTFVLCNKKTYLLTYLYLKERFMIRSDEDTDGLASKQHVLRVD